jgi:hypothetical protein
MAANNAGLGLEVAGSEALASTQMLEVPQGLQLVGQEEMA